MSLGMVRQFLVFFFCSCNALLFAQNKTIEGTIVNELDQNVHNIEILLVELDLNTHSDELGNFKFPNLPSGVFTLIAIYDGYSFPPVYADLRELNQKQITITLGQSEFNLEEVRLQTKTRAEKLKTNAIKAEVVSIEEESIRANSVEELINRAPGVKIRNVGGLGAPSNLLVGGFTGNSVKFLYDDIPIDYLGSNYSLSKIPTNAIESIEIYKGVLPTKLGIDALGSAINIVPKTYNRTSGAVSYEFGSFSTHIASVNTTFKLRNNLFVGTNSFYNFSQNNYKVDNLPFRDSETGQTQFIRERLFHNAFSQFSFEFFVQGRGLSWADMIEFKVNSYDLSKEIQNDPHSRARPFGEVYRQEKGTFIPSLRYKKYFFNNRLNLNQFLVYSKIDFELFDRAKNIYYDWKGRAHPTISSSEMGNLLMPGGYMHNELSQFTSRTNLNYLINHYLQIESNTVISNFNRKSNLDELNTDGTGYTKLISSLGLSADLFENKLESNTQIKYLLGKLSGSYEDNIIPNQSNPVTTTVENSGFSFSQALKYNINNNNFIRASYENTYRLPEQMELFGDNNFVTANYELKPEQSTNINLGFTHSRQKIRFEVNTYFRNTKDLIRLKDLNQYQAVYLNLDHVRGFGVELEAHYKPVKNLTFAGNLTWNEFRLKSSKDNYLNNRHFKNARIANLPYYYGNASVAFNAKELLNLKYNWVFFWDYSYVHQYYLDFIEKQFEPDGFLGLWGKSKINTNRVIPVQHLNNIGMVYTRDMEKRSISFSAELKNIFDTEIYNEFKMQSPGRHYRLKISYTF